jgi:hypothetical protein
LRRRLQQQKIPRVPHKRPDAGEDVVSFHVRSPVVVARTPRPVSSLPVQGEPILIRPPPPVVHSPQRRLRGVGQEKELAPVSSRADGSLLEHSPIGTGRETVVGFNEEPLPHPFFFIASDPLNPVPSHGRHLKERGHVLAVRPVELHAAMLAAVGSGVFALVEVAAYVAQLGCHQAALHSARRKDAARHAVLPALMVDDIPGTEFPQRKKTRPLNHVRLLSRRHQRTHRQAGEAVAGEKALAAQIAAWIEVRFVGFFAAVQEQINLVLGFALMLLCFLPFSLSSSGIIDGPSSLIALAHGRAVKLPPTAEGTVEGHSGAPNCVLQPLCCAPGGAANILPARVQNVSAFLGDLSQLALRKANSMLDVRIQRARGLAKIENLHHAPSQSSACGRQPHRVHVRPDQLLVAKVKPCRSHRPSHHAVRLTIEILVVRAALAAKGHHKGRLPAPPGAPAALGVIGRGRRYVPQVDHVEVPDVHAQLHRG